MSYTEDDLRITITGELYIYTNAVFPLCSGVVIPGVSPEQHPPYIAQVQTAPSTTATYLYEWDGISQEYVRVRLTTGTVEISQTMSWDVSLDGNTWATLPRADPVANPVPTSFASWRETLDPNSRLDPRPQVPVSLSDTKVDWREKQDELCRWWRETKRELDGQPILLDTELNTE